MEGEQYLNCFVRPLVTVLFTAVFCFGFVAGLIGADVFTTTATAVIIYWFRSRDEQKK